MREPVLMELEPPLVVSWSVLGSLLAVFVFCWFGLPDVENGAHKADPVLFLKSVTEVGGTLASSVEQLNKIIERPLEMQTLNPKP